MSPRQVSLTERVQEFKDECMVVFDTKKKLMRCDCYNVLVDWKKKSTVSNHCASDSHKSALTKFKLSNQPNKRQVSIDEAVDHAYTAKSEREQFVKSTVKAFMAANVPIKKLDHPKIREWMNRYVKGALFFVFRRKCLCAIFYVVL